MMTLFSFMPLITVAILCAFCGVLIVSHDRDVEREARQKKLQNHKTA